MTKPGMTKDLLGLCTVLALGAATVLLACGFTRHSAAVHATTLRVSGRIEGNETHLSVTMPAKVSSVAAQEGDAVKKGQLLVQLDDAQISTGLSDAKAVLTAAQDQEKLAEKLGAAAGVQGQLHLAALKTAVAQAKAQRDDLQFKEDQMKITSPCDGVCSVSNVHPAEVVTPGQPIMNIVDLNSVYLRAYVPEGQIGAVKIGAPAKVFIDSQPNRPFTARVVAIDPEASFTPENVYFQDDRVKQVFGVKIAIDNPNGYAKPGMPGDAEIALTRAAQ